MAVFDGVTVSELEVRWLAYRFKGAREGAAFPEGLIEGEMGPGPTGPAAATFAVRFAMFWKESWRFMPPPGRTK